MPTARIQDATGNLAAIQRAALRLNPTLDLECDIVVVDTAVGLSSNPDWTGANTTQTNVVSNPDGPVTLKQSNVEGSGTVIFSQVHDKTVSQTFGDAASSPGPVVQWIDWFPDVGTFGSQPITLDGLKVALALSSEFVNQGSIQVQITTFDDSWNRVPLCTPFNIPGTTINPTGVATPVVYQIKFADWLGGKQIIVDPGQFLTTSGPGRTHSGTEQFGPLPVDSSSGYPVCSIPNVPRGFSVGLLPQGPNAYTAQTFYCGAGGSAGTSSAPFDYTQFWESNGQSRSGGPYPATVVGGSPLDPNNNPGDGTLATGAIPGYGGTAVPYNSGDCVLMGHWGRAKQVLTASRAQNPAYNWEQPYHSLTATVFPSAGTQVAAVEMFPSGPNVGTAPTSPVQIQISDSGPKGTSISYVLKGSNSSITGAWTTIGTVLDGDICTANGVTRIVNNQTTVAISGNALYAFYQLTATLASAAPHFATPTLYSWLMVAQTTYATFGYMQDFDATETIDPVDGTTEIGEMKLSMLRAGPKDYRDLATRIVSQNAGSEIEAMVYAKDRVSGVRYFLNSYRLENRDPGDGVEEMTFTTGLDRLTTAIPQAAQSFVYPSPGEPCAPISTGGVSTYAGVSFGGFLNSNLAVIVVNNTTTPFAGVDLVGMYFYGITGTSKGQVFQIVAQPDTNTTGEAFYNPLNHSETQSVAAQHVFLVNCVDQLTGTIPMVHPVVGDTYQIQSQIYTRDDITYAGQTFAEVYADLINNQAVVPSRFRGAVPANTLSATTTDRVITNDNSDKTYNKALDYVSQVALHCGGTVAWVRGQIAFIPIYPSAGSSDSGIVWDDRTLVSLTPTVGADQRIPSVEVQYGYDLASQDFADINIFNDLNAVAVWGRSNIYDVYQVPDETCKWNDSAGVEAERLGNMLTGAWSTGKRLWKCETVMCYPWLNLGDGVSITTDMYTDFNGSASADGITITGFPVVGNQTARGVIVGKNLWGNQFVVALVQGLNSFASSGSGSGAPNLQPLVCPTITATITTEQGGLLPVNIASVAFVPPASAYYDHMELWVATDGGRAMLQAYGSVSPFKLTLNNTHTYTVTPYVVTTGAVRTAGTPLNLGPFTSNLAGVALPSLDDNNDVIYLPPLALADDGASAKTISKGAQSFLQRHGDTVTFPVAYQNNPNLYLYQGTTHEIRALWGTDAQIVAQSGNTTAYNTSSTETDDSGVSSITTSGLVVRARLAQPSAVSLTTRTANAAMGNSVNAGASGTALSLGANLPAYNDQYSVEILGKFITTASGFHTGVASMTATIDYSTNSGSTWTAGVATTLSTGTVGTTTTTVAASLLLAVSALPASTTDVRLRLGAASFSGAGGTVSATGRFKDVPDDSVNSVVWATSSSTVNYASKTPNATDTMSLTVYAPS